MEGRAATALIGAYEPGPGPGGLRALLPLAGMSLVEHQARRAVDAGAARILLLVDEMPAELTEAMLRLRHDGITAGMARGIDEAADAIGADENVLLIAEACLPEVALLQNVVDAPEPAVATVPDVPQHGQFERIDAAERWAGVALLSGHRVAETASMIGAWDPVSTLLRRAVQEGATRIEATRPPLLATDPAALQAAEQTILAGARQPADDLIGTMLFRPTEELAVPLLLARQVDADMVGAAAALLAACGGMLALAGWLWVGLLGLLLSGPFAAGAARLSRIRQGSRLRAHLFGRVRLIAAGLGAAGLARMLVGQSGQWGWWLTAGLLIAAMVGLWTERRSARSAVPIWLASADTLIWGLLPFAIAGRWGAGLAAATAYACGSFLWLAWQRVRSETSV